MPTSIGIVILHIIRIRGIVDDEQLVRSDSDKSLESVGELPAKPDNPDRDTNTSTSADSPMRSSEGGQDEGSCNGRSDNLAQDEGDFANSPNRASPLCFVCGSSGSASSEDADETATRTSTSPDLQRPSIWLPNVVVLAARPSKSPNRSTPSANQGVGDNVEQIATRERSVTTELSTLWREWSSEKEQLNVDIAKLRSAVKTAAHGRINNGQQDEKHKLLEEIEVLRSATTNAAQQREEEKSGWDRARRLLEEDKLILFKESEDLRSAIQEREEEKIELEHSKTTLEEEKQKLVRKIEDLFAASGNVAREREEERKHWDSTKASLMEQIRNQDPEISDIVLDKLKQDRLKFEDEIRVLQEVSVVNASIVCHDMAVCFLLFVSTRPPLKKTMIGFLIAIVFM
ncbi:hypothetical protein R1sor_024907 [Riccia sorocarpa]|uniref:Uncharacterized protein n=1 Tax=Riccia sorocarpa TaxID=122646 RepID=A0ABD3GTF2_9MARC